MEEGTGGRKYQLLDLPWEDVLVTHIFCYLPLRHLISLQRVSRQFHSFIQVYLANCHTFDFTQIGHSIPKEAFCSMLRDNKVLHNLALQNCSDWVTDKELLPVIGQNQHLLRVDMRGCECLSRHSLVAVSLSCSHLRHLGLAHCEWVDSLSLRSLADHCGGLQSIDLTACRQLKDDAICYLAKKCPRLRSLSVAVNANITDASVEEVAKSCRELEQLDLTGCLRVRNESIRSSATGFCLVSASPAPNPSPVTLIQTVAEYCPKLQSLKVNHCHNVTESSLGVLRKRNVEIDVEPPLQRALILLQDVVFSYTADAQFTSQAFTDRRLRKTLLVQLNQHTFPCSDLTVASKAFTDFCPLADNIQHAPIQICAGLHVCEFWQSAESCFKSSSSPLQTQIYFPLHGTVCSICRHGDQGLKTSMPKWPRRSVNTECDAPLNGGPDLPGPRDLGPAFSSACKPKSAEGDSLPPHRAPD
ncbi:hypothetical protein SKAU_G00145400 [Synaphobranchus kaupii]|uniref:F-box/LRR-repeat protein 15 n=1 Tax=Synaphobranchus kaupii TaxID=118154 RepID=A0A9Q1FTH9_SYNKA|nr:hypothetical protein SKAU_G00145400 [Synaphobranchus kaupii]